MHCIPLYLLLNLACVMGDASKFTITLCLTSGIDFSRKKEKKDWFKNNNYKTN